MKKWLWAALLVATIGASSVSAALIINVSEVGNDVVATASGSADIDELTLNSPWEGIGIVANVGWLAIGVDPGGSGGLYVSISGPSDIGSGSTSYYATSSSGDPVGVFLLQSALLLPNSYVSGASLSGTATWENSTISDLGLTEGQYVYTWGSGNNADSLTLNIGAVPEPMTTGLLGVSCGVLWLVHCLKKSVNYYRT